MKRAIVTGGIKGIGLGIAKMLLDEGYEVTVTYAHDERCAKVCADALGAESKSFEIIKADQSDKASMQAFVMRMQQKPTIDCIVFNAGTTLREPLSKIKDDDWERVMQVNVNSNVYLLRDLMHIIPAGSRIVFIGSLMAIHPHGTSLAYGVTKSAIHALTTNLVKVFEGTGTTVNCIAPGFVETEWQREKPEEIRRNICRKTANGRFATVEEVADAVKFCIHNSFVNGSIIELSGGYSYK